MRRIFYLSGRPFVFASEHPREERVVFLTDDYRLDGQTFLLPEVLAWDGVETCPDVWVAPGGDE